MINLTDRISIYSESDLNYAIRHGIHAVSSHLQERYGTPSSTVSWRSNHCFQHFLSPRNIKKRTKFGQHFLDAALDLCCLNSRNEGLSHILDRFDINLNGLRPKATGYPSIKQGVKILLVHLWQEGVILLPTKFSPGAHFEPIAIRRELYKFAHGFSGKGIHEEVNGGNSRRLFYYMPRVLFAASWDKVEDVDIFEFAELHRAQRIFCAGQSNVPFITSPVPWLLFLVELKKSFAERVGYSLDDLKRYSQWAARGIVEVSFCDFKGRKEKLLSPRGKRNEKLETVSNEGPDELVLLAASREHADAQRYYQQFSGMRRAGFDWLSDSIKYPGREHVNIEENVKNWRIAVQAFMKHRKTVRGLEDEKGVATSLNHLADYLFLYLPWWKEIFQDSSLPLPLAPKDFSRCAFFSRQVDEPIDRFPATFPEMLRLRRSGKYSQYAALKHVQIFFKFVEAHFAEDDDIAGAEFRSPVFGEFDLPRLQKRTKTSKVTFPKSVYTYLTHYVYAVEAMGEYLFDKCRNAKFRSERIRYISTQRWLDASWLGFVPFVLCRGKLTPVFFIPNVFTWATRRFRDEGGLSVERFVPHLTTLRVLIGAIETGLRVSGLRWLDRRTWDQENRGEEDVRDFCLRPHGKYVFTLFVNTDKTKDEPWVTGIVYRVRALLLREQAFRDSIQEEHMDEAVPYKGREDSRFGNIVPLFRSSISSNPISETTYQGHWVLLLTGFQEFYPRIVDQSVKFIRVIARTEGGDKSDSKVVVMEDGVQYCPVSILAINTPHSCRATFATNRQGVLEASDIAMLLGHANENVTRYYMAPRAEDLYEKLEAGDRAVFDDIERCSKNSASYVRPDKPDSAMARCFTGNRDVALKQFGVMPAISIWSTAESEGMKPDEIERLRKGPMSLVRFHSTHICPVGDECPSDIVQSLGGYMRCGMCPLAIKGIDHLPAIAAKKNLLLERIKYQIRECEDLKEGGESAAAEFIWDAIELDTNEWIGWQLSEEVLSKNYAEIQAVDGDGNASDVYHVESPEIVRKHLACVARNSGEAEFLLCRIAESNAYPTMQTPRIQAVASGIRRRLLGGRDSRDFLAELPGPADITFAASLLKTVMRVNKLCLADVGKELAKKADIPVSAHLRLGDAQ